jgi:hypothetical protein
MTDVITNQPGDRKVTFGEEEKAKEEKERAKEEEEEKKDKKKEEDTDKDEEEEEPFDRFFRPLQNIVLAQARG